MIQCVTAKEINMLDQTTMEKVAQKAVKQPKIAMRILRYLKNVSPNCELAIRDYELNRNTEAEAASRENMFQVLRRGM